MENELDKLFEEKLKNYQKEPAGAAWEQIQKELGHEKKPFPWMRVAASGAILIAAGVLTTQLLTQSPVTEEGASIHPDHPTLPQAHIWAIPQVEQEALTQSVAKHPSASQKSQNINQPDPANEAAPSQTMLKAPEVTAKRSVADIAPAPLTDIPLSTESLKNQAVASDYAVQITYKAVKDTVETEDKSKLEQLWTRAKEIKPGEMFASIRQAKNDLFNK